MVRAAAVCLGLLALLSPLAAAPYGAAPFMTVGRIEGIDSYGWILLMDNGALQGTANVAFRRNYHVGGNTIVTANGGPANVNVLRVGLLAEVWYDRRTKEIVRIDVQDPTQQPADPAAAAAAAPRPVPPPDAETLSRATVEKVDVPNKLLVVNRAGDGVELRFKLGPRARVLIDGLSAKLDSLKRGQKVDVWYYRESGRLTRVLGYDKDPMPPLPTGP